MKKLMNKIRKSNKGFTLVELIIVVAIIAVLSAVLVPQYIQYVEKSRIGADEAYISEVAHNLEIVGATDTTVNGKEVTVTISAAGAISVASSNAAAKTAVETELTALFPASEQEVVSNYYKTGAGAGTATATLGTNGVVVISGTKNING